VLEKLRFCPSELNPDSAALMKWRRFEKVEAGINLDSGEVYKETIPFELVNFLKPTLQNLFVTIT
jgi:hypothetical protein